MNEFKKGDKVYLRKVGKWATVLSVGKNKYDIEDEEGTTGWVFESDMEKFIEPKYSIGDKIYCYPSSHKDEGMGDTCEIVKFALNKKDGAYSYMAFNKNGFVYSFKESQVILVPKKPKIITMTASHIEEMFSKWVSAKGGNVLLKITK